VTRRPRQRVDQRAATAGDDVALVAAAQHLDAGPVDDGQVEQQLDRRGALGLDPIFGAGCPLQQPAHPAIRDQRGMTVEIVAHRQSVEGRGVAGVILGEQRRVGIDPSRDRPQPVRQCRGGDRAALVKHDGLVRRRLAIEQRKAADAQQAAQVRVVGIDQLPPALIGDAALLHRVHPPAEPRPRLVESRVDPDGTQVMQRAQTGDAAAEDRDASRLRPRRRLPRQHRGHAAGAECLEHAAAGDPPVPGDGRGEAVRREIRRPRRRQCLQNRAVRPHRTPLPRRCLPSRKPSAKRRACSPSRA
jgi:hypothetical protein